MAIGKLVLQRRAKSIGDTAEQWVWLLVTLTVWCWVKSWVLLRYSDEKLDVNGCSHL